MFGYFGFRGSGLPQHSSSHRVDAAKATYRPSRGQNAATTMMANAQAAGGEDHRSCFSSSQTSGAGLGDGSMGRHASPRHNAGGAPRDGGQAQPPQAAVVRRHGRSSHFRALFCGWVGSAQSASTSPPTMARRSTFSRWRPKRWATGWTRLPSCGPTAPHTGITSRDLFSGKPSRRCSFLASWRGGHFGIATHWSKWSRDPFGHKNGSSPFTQKNVDCTGFAQLFCFIFGEMFSCGALPLPLGLATAAGRSIPSQPPLLLARGERRSARDTQRSRAQRARKQARAFWWRARSALELLC